MFARILVYLSVFTVLSAQMMTGGWQKQDTNSDEIQSLVNKAISKYNAESNDLFYHIPIDVKSAESQVVAGMQYKITMVLGKSSCMKNQVQLSEFNAANCEEHESKDRKEVTAQIWVKPWENFEEIKFI